MACRLRDEVIVGRLVAQSAKHQVTNQPPPHANGAKWAAIKGRVSQSNCRTAGAAPERLTQSPLRQYSHSPYTESLAHTRHIIRFLQTAACSRQSCFDTPLGCESLRDDIQVRAAIGRQGNAHRTRWASLFDERHSKLAICEGRGARDAVGSYTRDQPLHIVTVREATETNF